MNPMNLSIYISELKNLVSCPHDTYQQLYAGMLNQFVNYYKDNVDVSVDNQLLLTLTTLKLKRGIFLPRQSEIEVISEAEPQWTYALFLVSLFWGISNKNIESIEAIMGTQAIAWIKGNDSLYRLFCHSISGENNTVNDLTNIVRKAAKKLDLSEKSTLVKPSEKIDSNQTNIIDSLISWLKQHINNVDEIFLLEDGLFISKSMLVDHPNFEEIRSHSDLICNIDISPVNFTDRRILSGYVIKKENLPSDLLNLPTNSTYQKHMTL